MGSSLLGLGSSYKGEATAGFRQLADLETNREMANDDIEAKNEEMKKQRQTAQIGGALTGAAAGATYGSSMGPYGIVVGAVAGYALSSLF